MSVLSRMVRRPVDGSAPAWQVAAAVVGLQVAPVAVSVAGAPVPVLALWAVPVGGAVTALMVAARVEGHRLRRDHAVRGFGIDPDAPVTGDRPWPVTAAAGHRRALFADGLAWSVAGCPTPPRRRRLLRCEQGHPAVIPQLGLLSPVGRLLGREPGRWMCPQGHRGVLPERPPVTTTTTGAAPAPVVVLPVRSGDLTRDTREVA